MIKRWCIQNKYSIFVMLLLICFCGYNISKSYGFVLFPDEFGYWVYAAIFAGYDWSDIVSLGSYYSYGYSLILFPIFILCKDAVMAYRVALGVNYILLICVFFVWKRVAKRLFDDEKGNTVVFYVAIAVLYPSWLFYARTTLAEIVIVTLYAVICMLLYDYLEHNRMSTLSMLALALVYIYFVHMRTVAILIACVITLIIYYVVKKRKVKQCIAFVVMLAIILVSSYFLKEWITGNIYATSEKVNANDYAGQIGKVTYMFTKEGIVNLIVSVAGKMLYLGVASFGLGFWGIGYGCKQIFEAIKDWKTGKEITIDKWFYLFVLLAFAGAMMVNAIYTIRPSRVDALAYGRYHEYIIPILMILGAKELKGRERVSQGLIAIILSMIFMTILVTWSLYTYGQTDIEGCMIVGMGYLYHPENFEPIRFYWLALLLGIILTVSVTLILNKVGKNRSWEFLLVFVIAIELILAERAGALYLDSSALGAYRDTKIAQKIEQLGEMKDREVYYLHGDNDALISIVQFMLRDEDIIVLREENMLQEKLGQEDLLLIDYRNPLAEELQKQYDSFIGNGHFILYYNY